MNYIDDAFDNLIKFIKERNYEEMFSVIKQNFYYQRKRNVQNYKIIADYYNKYQLWGAIDLDKEIYEVIENNAKTLHYNCEEFIILYNHLQDYYSKIILLNILYYWLMLDYERIDQLIDKYYFQYFDLDLIKQNNNEIFIDVGAYTGDTLNRFLKIYNNNYKKIYCYEIANQNIEEIKKIIKDHKNIILREKAAFNINGHAYIDEKENLSTTGIKDEGTTEIETVKIDDDIKGKITFVKMDIEGGEVEAIEGMKKKIKKYKPKLAISVYHHNNHLWKIPKMLLDLNPNYKLYLRYYGGKYVPTEYILYAV